MEEDFGAVIEFSYGQDNKARLTVMHHGVRIHMTILTKNLEESPQLMHQYLNYLKTAEIETDGSVIEELFDWILRECSSELNRLAPPPDSFKADTASLKDYVHAKTFYVTVHSSQDNYFTLQKEDAPVGSRSGSKLGARVPEQVCSTWPIFKTSDIMICADSWEQAVSQVPREVTTGGSDRLFFKPYRFCDSKLARRELTSYEKIRSAELNGLRISRLEGLVQDQQGILFGLLLSYIDGEPLGHLFMPSIAKTCRQQWVRQITSTLHSLHEAGIVWGDAKPDNILIDTSSNAWIIDFGGGNTEGWVDLEVAGTKEGDEQGLSRIVNFVLDEPLND
jgi:hypothetical protein